MNAIAETLPPSSPGAPTRAAIDAFEDSIVAGLIAGALQPCDFKTRHYFIEDGLIYVRAITAPAKSVLTGQEHLGECLNMVPVGKIAVASELGRKVITGGGPGCMFVSGPGTRRAGWAEEETIYVTFHLNPTRETDIEKLEALLVKPPRAELMPVLEQLKAKGLICHSS